MRRTSPHILILAGCLTVTPQMYVHAATFPHSWSQRFGDTAQQIAHSVAADNSGNVIVTGSLFGTANFGGGDLTSAGSNDVFVVKFSTDGIHQWSKRFGDASIQYARSVTTDASGNVIIAGDFQGTVNFGGGDLTSVGSYDIFVVKLSSAGDHQWSKRFGDASSQTVYSVATDGSGNVIVTGPFAGTVNFGGGNLTSAGGADIFVAKLSSGAGAQLWARRFGDTSDQIGESVAADGAGNVLVTGSFAGSVDFGGGILASAGLNDIFVAKLKAADGAHTWSKHFGDAANQMGHSVATDENDNVLVTGDFAGKVDFGGGSLTGAGGNDIFVAKFNSAGVHQWGKRFGDAADQYANSVATDGSNNVIVAGFFQGTVDFGGGGLTTAGLADIFVAKLNSAGTHRWSQRFGDASDYQYANSVATDLSESLILAGHFGGAVDFGGGYLISLGATPYFGDAFVAKFGGLAGEPVITSILDFANDQGGQVRISFLASGADGNAVSNPVVQYEAYRRIDPIATPSSAVRTGPRWDPKALASDWEFAGAIPAHAVGSYFMVAPTQADSTIAAGQHYSAFFIRAATDAPSLFYDSTPDSGYSVDNLAPGIPTSFAYVAGLLTWDESTAKDFDYFSVYGANTNSFAAATLIDYSVTPAMDVSASPYSYYFTTATDFSGNEGKPAVVNTLSGVGGTPKSYVLSISSYPNPFNPQTTIRYTVPSRGRVEVSIYDPRGAHVVTLVDEYQDAGAYTKQWNASDAGGRTVSSGVYFARVTHATGTKSYKMMLLK